MAMPSQLTFADKQEKLEFAAAIEETLGHLWALEQNLDEGNAELALIHATHPMAELYPIMKPELQEADPSLDSQIMTTLLDLKDKANTEVSRQQAQQAIDDAKKTMEIARKTIVGEQLSNDPSFKMELMKGLLETSIVEYGEAVFEEVIEEVAEFQDGSAFVWRSQQIFNEIKTGIDPQKTEEIEEFYSDLWAAYDLKSDPSNVETLADGIIHEINESLGIEGEERELSEYVETINHLLTDAKAEYHRGNSDLALSYVTKAYLDNYEFLEGPLIEAGERELMEEVETMMREELRDMIKSGAAVSEVDSQIDKILEKIDTVAVIVPEFGTIAVMVLAIAIVSIIAVTAQSKLNLTARI